MNEYAFSERHMGTTMSLSFICPSEEQANIMAKEVFETIHAYEQRFSRFIVTSELSQLNANTSMVVSDEFMAVLNRAFVLHRITHGIFNPLVQVARLGYTATFSHLAKTTQTVDYTTYNTTMEDISVQATSNRITLAPGQQLDFGGILKGYLAQLLADSMQKQYPDCNGLIINLGGDIATRGYNQFHQPFIFLLYNPVTGEETPVTVINESLATSGTYARVWQSTDGTKNHIVDSRTNDSVISTITTASVIHKDGAFTEALAKMFILCGETETLSTIPCNTCDYRYYLINTDGIVINHI